MFEGTAYALEVSSKKGRQSYYFLNEDEAVDSYLAIIEKFRDDVISIDPIHFERKGVRAMSLSVTKTHFGRVPKGALASFSPHRWLNDSVLDEVQKMAMELHTSSESGINP